MECGDGEYAMKYGNGGLGEEEEEEVVRTKKGVKVCVVGKEQEKRVRVQGPQRPFSLFFTLQPSSFPLTLIHPPARFPLMARSSSSPDPISFSSLSLPVMDHITRHMLMPATTRPFLVSGIFSSSTRP